MHVVAGLDLGGATLTPFDDLAVGGGSVGESVFSPGELLRDQWAERALEYAPQLMTYAMAIEMAGGTVIGKFIHFTIGGGIVEVGDA